MQLRETIVGLRLLQVAEHAPRGRCTQMCVVVGGTSRAGRTSSLSMRQAKHQKASASSRMT